MRTPSRPLLAILALSPLLGSMAPARAQEVQVGERFPDLALPRLEDGRVTRLSELTAERRVLLIQFASW